MSDENRENPDNSELVEQPIKKILQRDDLDESAKQELRAIIQRSTTTFLGPIPPPETIAGYEEVLPGSADRILSMAEKEGEHRRGIENKIVTMDGIRSFLGLGAGFIIAIVGLGGSIYLGINGKSWASGIMSAGTLTGLVTVFVTGEKRRSAETDQDED